MSGAALNRKLRVGCPAAEKTTEEQNAVRKIKTRDCFAWTKDELDLLLNMH